MKQPNSNKLTDSENHFKIPEQYFEHFDEQLFSKWETQKTAAVKRSRFISRFTYIGVAATIVLFLAVNFWNQSNTDNSLSTADIENYLNYTAASLPTEIEKDFTQEDLKALEKSLKIDALKIDEYLLSSTDIEYYLNE